MPYLPGLVGDLSVLSGDGRKPALLRLYNNNLKWGYTARNNLDQLRSSEYNVDNCNRLSQERIGTIAVNGYLTTREAAEKWGITPRQVQYLCKEDRIVGATRMSWVWIIPASAKKPTCDRPIRSLQTDDHS